MVICTALCRNTLRYFVLIADFGAKWRIFGPFWGAGPGLSRPAGPAVLRTAVGGFAAPPGLRPGFPGGPFGGPAGRQNPYPPRQTTYPPKAVLRGLQKQMQRPPTGAPRQIRPLSAALRAAKTGAPEGLPLQGVSVLFFAEQPQQHRGDKPQQLIGRQHPPGHPVQRPGIGQQGNQRKADEHA